MEVCAEVDAVQLLLELAVLACETYAGRVLGDMQDLCWEGQCTTQTVSGA